MISVKNLQKYYNKGRKNEQHVLKNVNLDLEETGLVCILGESGCGKTTLLNAIGGLDTFSDGTIQIEDTVLTGYDPKTMEPIRNDRFGFIFQNYYLLQDYTVGYNVKLALNRYELTEEEKESRVDYVLSMLGILKYKKKQVSKLSGGQQQRVSIARVLVKAPDIILADEPTGNLDEDNTIRTMMILKSISKECLVLLVTHERRIANFFADRIIEIRDGEIVRDEKNHSSAAYERSDDFNIYLPEFTYSEIGNDYAKLRLYYEKDTELPKLALNLVMKDGKLYIQNKTDCDIVLEGEENGVQILSEERAPLEMEEVDQFSYDLSKPKGSKKASLPMREVRHMAVENIKMMGKKQGFILIVLLAAAILLSVTLAEFMNSVLIDKESVISTDSHYVKLTFGNISVFNENEQLRILEYIWENLDETEYGELFFVPKINLYLTGQEFAQLKDLKQMIRNFSYVSTEHLKQETLLYGRMPQTRTEVVVDRLIIEALIESGDVVSSLYKGVDSYLDARLMTSIGEAAVTIVGICDSGEPDIYCGQNILLSFDSNGYAIASLAELQAEYPEDYAQSMLGEDEMLMREGLYAALSLSEDEVYYIGSDKVNGYRIVGTCSDDVGVDYVFSETGCRNVRDLMIYKNRSGMLYTEQPTEAAEYFSAGGAINQGNSSGKFQLSTAIPYQEELLYYEQLRTNDLDAKGLVTVAAVVIAVLMIYFMVKSNVYSRSEELTVYRLIGISKGSILLTYILEMTLLTCCTSLPAVLATSGVIHFIAGIPSLEIGMTFPWWSVLLLLAAIYVVHCIISILPVLSMLSKPPATLAARE